MSDPFQTATPDTSPFVHTPYDPERGREWIRGAVTVVAMLIFAGVVGGYLYGALAISDKDHWDRFKEASAVVLPAVTSVLGSALGFYFGSQKR